MNPFTAKDNKTLTARVYFNNNSKMISSQVKGNHFGNGFHKNTDGFTKRSGPVLSFEMDKSSIQKNSWWF
jgi:hypothetical protein